MKQIVFLFYHNSKSNKLLKILKEINEEKIMNKEYLFWITNKLECIYNLWYSNQLIESN